MPWATFYGSSLEPSPAQTPRPSPLKDVTAKPVVPRDMAKRDIDEAINDCHSEGPELVAVGLVDAWEGVY
jgi:hypothetical protein